MLNYSAQWGVANASLDDLNEKVFNTDVMKEGLKNIKKKTNQK